MKKNILLASFTLLALSINAQVTNFSLHFDGTDDYVSLPASNGITGDEFTIEGWFKCAPGFYPQVLLMAFQDEVTPNANVTVEVRGDGKLRFSYRESAGVAGGSEIFTSRRYDDEAWHHFAAVKFNQGSRLVLFVDGFSEGIVDVIGGNIVGLPIIELGRNRYAAAENFRRFKGNVDDLKIWNKGKDPCEVFSEWKSEHAGTEIGLFSNYKFDINSDTIFDCSLNKLHGARFGSLGVNNKPQFSLDRPTLVDVDCGFQLVSTDEDEYLVKGGELSVKLSPNPVDQEFVTIETNSDAHLAVQVFSMSGILVREANLQGQTSLLNISGLPSGTYSIRITTGREVVVAKITKS